ncbi:MAG: squalene/phytoene synthase family protein [Planctomycetaceae bacterium]|nr:squalene/phytoene synthase family protein [Planctomycetaceae bacterium]
MPSSHHTPSLAESSEYCRILAKRTARNFYYSFLTLPRDRFRAMCALYAFMRVTDDLGDDEIPGVDRAAALARWRSELLFAWNSGHCEHPVLPAVINTLRKYQVPLSYLLDVIAGVEMDLGSVAIGTFDELSRYCYHVAGAVGLACIHLWGFHDQRALPAAVDCGTAFQLTNILRDLREDAVQGRIYLPREDLAQFGLTAQNLIDGDRDERFRQMMQFEVARTREFYGRAHGLFEYLDPPGRPILDTMLQIYGGVLDEIERRQYDVFTRRVELSRARKLLIAGQTIVKHKLRRIFPQL